MTQERRNTLSSISFKFGAIGRQKKSPLLRDLPLEWFENFELSDRSIDALFKMPSDHIQALMGAPLEECLLGMTGAAREDMLQIYDLFRSIEVEYELC